DRARSRPGLARVRLALEPRDRARGIAEVVLEGPRLERYGVGGVRPARAARGLLVLDDGPHRLGERRQAALRDLLEERRGSPVRGDDAALFVERDDRLARALEPALPGVPLDLDGREAPLELEGARAGLALEVDPVDRVGREPAREGERAHVLRVVGALVAERPVEVDRAESPRPDAHGRAEDAALAADVLDRGDDRLRLAERLGDDLLGH